VILTHDYPPYQIGGIGAFCKDLAEALGRRGIDVLVIAGRPEKASERIRVGNENNVEILWVSRGAFPPRHFWFQVRNNSLIRSEIANCEVVHGQDFAAFPTIYFSKKRNPGLPWVVTLHSGPISELYCVLRSMNRGGSLGDIASYGAGFPAWDWALRGDIGLADALVAVSQDVRREIQIHYSVDARRIFTINTGVNVDELKQFAKSLISREPDSNTKVIRLFYAGRLSWRKGILQLLRSVAYLTVKLGFSRYQLEIFGKGPLAGRVYSAISEFHLGRNIAVRGFVTRSELLTAMAKSDIVCVPSLYEACPVSMIEAMAMGKPVVTFDRPFSRELLDGVPDSAIGAEVQDYAALLHSLGTSEDLRRKLGARLQIQAAKKFDMKIIAEQYAGLYKRLLS